MKKSLISVLGGLVLFAALSTLSSCDNFLNGSEVAKDIKYTIDYNNAPKVKVELYCNDEMGSLYPNNFYDARLGFDFKIQFIPNKNYTVKNPEKLFMAVSRKDNSKSMADYVKFTPIPQTPKDKADGIYYYNIKVVKASSDIRISPINDSIPPVVKTVRLARTQEDAMKGTNLISMEEFSHYATNASYEGDSTIVAQKIYNHHVNKVWVYLEAEDGGSGIDYIEVKEQLIYNISGSPVQGTLIDQNASLGMNCFYNNSGKNNFEACFEYNFKSTNDGVVRLNFTANDQAGMSTTYNQSVDLIKDTELPPTVSIVSDEIQFIEDYENPHNVTYNLKMNLNNSTDDFRYIKDLDGKEYNDGFVIGPDENDFTGNSKVVAFEYGYNESNMTLIDLRGKNFPFTSGTIIQYDPTSGQNITITEKEGEQVIYLYNIDPYKIVYYQITVEDPAGNIRYISGNTDPLSDILSFTIEKKGTTTYQLNFLVTNNFGRRLYIRNIDNTPVVFSGLKDSYIFYNNTNYDSLPDTILVSSYSNYKSLQFHGKALKLQKCKDNDQNNSWRVISESAEELSSADIPYFTVTVDRPRNAGKYFVQVNLDPNFNYNQDYYYLIKYTAMSIGGSPYTAILAEKTFELYYNQTTPCDVSIIVCNKYGSQLESVQHEEIACNIDNIPPAITGWMISNFLQNSFVAYISISDDTNQGISLGNSGIKTTKYLFSESLIDDDTIDWENNPDVKSLEFNDSNIYTLEIDEIYPNVIYFYIEDNNTNYTIKHLENIYETKNYQLQLEYDSSNGQLIENIPYSLVNGFTPKTQNYYLNNNTWEALSDSIDEYGTINIDYNSETLNYSKAITLSESENSSFIKITPYESYNSEKGPRTVRDSTTYLYLPYLINKGTENEIVCHTKDFILGNVGINILTFQPCFAHTMYSKKNAGNRPEDWLRFGVARETGLAMDNTGFTYSYSNQKEVPEGYYYTTIIHFADGTMMMTPVQLMQ